MLYLSNNLKEKEKKYKYYQVMTEGLEHLQLSSHQWQLGY